MMVAFTAACSNLERIGAILCPRSVLCTREVGTHLTMTCKTEFFTRSAKRDTWCINEVMSFRHGCKLN